MPKDDDKVETISVTRAKAEAGLELKPGHKTVIIIEDGGPTTTTTCAPGGTTTVAPGETTTAAPGGTTTAAPGGTTTAAPGGTTTKAPGGTTTAAPAATTTAAPGETTTKAPAGTTTAAPAATTTAAPAATTTAAPAATTTAAPGETTTAAPHGTTTKEPGYTTTAAPGSTTTAAPAATTTAAPGTTTTGAPKTTTTAAPGTTTTAAPATTTTAAPATTTTAAPKTTTTAAPATSTTAPPPTTTAPQGTTTKAPTTTTTKKPITPSAQCVFGSAHFETDKIFPLPAALDTFKALVKYANDNPKRIYLVVGHTDAQGPVAHNKDLSNERAQSIVQFLKEDADAWVPYFDDGKKGITSKTWGTREDQWMLTGLGLYKRDVSGKTNADFTKAVRDFQTSQNDAAKKTVLPVTGTMDAKTRKALIVAYMKIEGTSVPKTLKMLTLGCGQGHQIEDKVDSLTNRRTDVFAFESEPILPSPEDCRSKNPHPKGFKRGLKDCTVYEQWLKEVTEKIGS